jgi:endonuclease III related protein
MARAAARAPRRLAKLYTRLRGHFGYVHAWWPGTPLEITLSALLVQQCDWSAVWAGIGRLRERELASLPSLAAAKPEDVQECIRGVAFAPIKAGRLIALARALVDRGHNEIQSYLFAESETAALRKDLLSLDGIGDETADCILLFAGQRPSFVIDAYTRRAMMRIDLFPELGTEFWSQPYGHLQSFFEGHIRAEPALYAGFSFAEGVPCEVALFRDFHAQLVELGKHHCLKTGPRCHDRGKLGWPSYEPCLRHCEAGVCHGCPLSALCRHGQGGQVL